MSDDLDLNPWDQVLERLRTELDGDDFRRWFAPTAYASDSGDRISVWTPSESVRRHLSTQYTDLIDQALAAIGRAETTVRFLVSGFDEDEGDG